MKNILVTGGAGYIGSHMVLELIKNGYTPIVIDNLSRSNKKNLESIEKFCGTEIKFINKDLTKPIDDLELENIDGIIHFAAYKYVGESVKNPLLYYKNNVVGLINLLDWAQKNKIDKFIFSSSCSVYGTPVTNIVDEESEIKPESPYGDSKAICERILKNYSNATNTKIAVLRYFNVAGNSTAPLIGDLDLNPQTLLPSIVTAFLGIKEFKFTLFGIDYPTKDGSCIRDYIHVQDLVDAHLKSLEYLNSHSGVNIFNLGNGIGTSVLEIIKSFEQITGKKLDYNIAPRRSGDAVAIYSNPQKAKTELGWVTKKDINEMIRSTLEWYKEGFIN